VLHFRDTASAHEELQCTIIDALKTAGRLDAVLISLHGACGSDLDTDVEGHTLERVRAVVGAAVPIVCTPCHGTRSPEYTPS